MAKPDPSLTPEQQLLSLIEAKEKQSTEALQKGSDSAAATPSAASSLAKSKTVEKSDESAVGIATLPALDWAKLLSMNAWKGRAAFLADQILAVARRPREPIDLKIMNKWAMLVFFGLLFYSVVALAFEWQVVNRNYDTYFTQPKTEIGGTELPTTTRVNSDLFEDAESRNVFSPKVKGEPVAGKSAEGGTASASGVSLQLVEMTQQLKLTGLSINPDDPARTFCMIEDLKKNMTSFLREGDVISGLTVAKITSSGVILKHKSDQIELR